jgi:hypothetical protein
MPKISGQEGKKCPNRLDSEMAMALHTRVKINLFKILS